MKLLKTLNPINSKLQTLLQDANTITHVKDLRKIYFSIMSDAVARQVSIIPIQASYCRDLTRNKYRQTFMLDYKYEILVSAVTRDAALYELLCVIAETQEFAKENEQSLVDNLGHWYGRSISDGYKNHRRLDFDWEHPIDSETNDYCEFSVDELFIIQVLNLCQYLSIVHAKYADSRYAILHPSRSLRVCAQINGAVSALLTPIMEVLGL